MKKQKRVKAVKRRRPYFKGRLLMRLHNSHAGTIFSGVRQRKGKKKKGLFRLLWRDSGAAGVNRFRTNGKRAAH